MPLQDTIPHPLSSSPSLASRLSFSQSVTAFARERRKKGSGKHNEIIPVAPLFPTLLPRRRSPHSHLSLPLSLTRLGVPAAETNYSTADEWTF